MDGSTSRAVVVCSAATAFAAAVVLRRWWKHRSIVSRGGVHAAARPKSPSLHRPGKPLQQAVGMDIGGTLAKIVYFVPRTELPTSPEVDAANDRAREFILTKREYGTTGTRDLEQEFFSPELNGTLHFIKFETSRMDGALEMIKAKGLTHAGTHVYGTGGGAVKFQKAFKDKLDVGVQKFDELETLVNGMGFLMYHYPNECYTLRNFRFGESTHMKQKFRRTGPQYPYLLVNIGTGVSMLLVESEGNFKRVGGTALGGGTFFGLVTLLTGCETFQDAIDLARQGNHMNVDLLVRDIYGGDYGKFGLRGTVIASSFGKMLRERSRSKAKPSDLALATLQMVSMNIGMLAHLLAEAHGATCTLFAGNFLQKNPFARRTLAYYTDFASKGSREALFLAHEGYFGATGALLHHFREQLATHTPRPSVHAAAAGAEGEGDVTGRGPSAAKDGGGSKDEVPNTPPPRTKVRSVSM